MAVALVPLAVAVLMSEWDLLAMAVVGNIVALPFTSRAVSSVRDIISGPFRVQGPVIRKWSSTTFMVFPCYRLSLVRDPAEDLRLDPPFGDSPTSPQPGADGDTPLPEFTMVNVGRPGMSTLSHRVVSEAEKVRDRSERDLDFRPGDYTLTRRQYQGISDADVIRFRGFACSRLVVDLERLEPASGRFIAIQE